MASNITPKSYEPLVEHLEDAADGAHTHEATIGLQQNKEAGIRTDLEALVGKPASGGNPPVPGLKSLWNVAKANKTAATAALRSVISDARPVVSLCINTLKTVLGSQWNSAWNAAGFTAGSLALPANPMTLLQQLRSYYIANPAREITVNGIACTAVNCEALAQAISTAQSASNQSNTDAGAAQAALEAGMVAGRKRLTGLREELTQLIGDDDDRWYAFGFEKPSDPTTPEIPQNLVLTAGAVGSHMIFIDWDDARRAENYRVRVKNVATNVELFTQITQDSEITVPNLPPGITVGVTITSRNAEGGESAVTSEYQIIVP